MPLYGPLTKYCCYRYGTYCSKYANRSRREDNEKYSKGDNEGKLFRLYDGRGADPEIKDNAKKANDGTFPISYPWMPNTGSTSKQSNF